MTDTPLDLLNPDDKYGLRALQRAHNVSEFDLARHGPQLILMHDNGAEWAIPTFGRLADLGVLSSTIMATLRNLIALGMSPDEVVEPPARDIDPDDDEAIVFHSFTEVAHHLHGMGATLIDMGTNLGNLSAVLANIDALAAAMLADAERLDCPEVPIRDMPLRAAGFDDYGELVIFVPMESDDEE